MRGDVADMGDVRGTRRRPWRLRTPRDGAEFAAYRDPGSEPAAIVVRAGSLELRYHLRCLNDLHEMLKELGGWMVLGGAEEKTTAAPGTVEAWARSAANPVKGWYGLQKGARGRFADFIPPIMEALALAEVEKGPGAPRMRAI